MTNRIEGFFDDPPRVPTLKELKHSLTSLEQKIDTHSTALEEKRIQYQHHRDQIDTSEQRIVKCEIAIVLIAVIAFLMSWIVEGTWWPYLYWSAGTNVVLFILELCSFPKERWWWFWRISRNFILVIGSLAAAMLAIQAESIIWMVYCLILTLLALVLREQPQQVEHSKQRSKELQTDLTYHRKELDRATKEIGFMRIMCRIFSVD